MSSGPLDKNAQAQEATAKRVQNVLETLLRVAEIGGEIVVFGSFSNGFKTGGSDLDVVLVTKQKSQSDSVTTLNNIATLAPKYDFSNITKIFQANVPILKFTDAKDNMEIDFCINNMLGIRNSLLLQTYCKLDERIPRLGRMVKAWAKRHEIVGTADGCLNSYAYMLLVIYYLQIGTDPPVAVNLQALGTGVDPVIDYKWGAEGGDAWDTQFLSDVSQLPRTKNDLAIEDLLTNFFDFYLNKFDLKKDAVSMRIAERTVVKESLLCFAQSAQSDPDQWCVEDPFDLKHNLAGKCTSTGKKRIMEEFANAYQNAQKQNWMQIIDPKPKSALYYLKCRVSGAVTPQAMLEEFETFNLNKLYFPKVTDHKNRFQQAFLEFTTNECRRKAHTKNETYVADCQLQMHYTSRSALNDSLLQSQYSTYDMQSYKMQRVILERESGARPNPNAASFFPGMQYGIIPPGLSNRWEFMDDDSRRREEMEIMMADNMRRRGLGDGMVDRRMDPRLSPLDTAFSMQNRNDVMDMRMQMLDRRSPFHQRPDGQPLSAREKGGHHDPRNDPRMQQMARDRWGMVQQPPSVMWNLRGLTPSQQQHAQALFAQQKGMKGMSGMMDPTLGNQFMAAPAGKGAAQVSPPPTKKDELRKKEEQRMAQVRQRYNLAPFEIKLAIPENLQWKTVPLLKMSENNSPGPPRLDVKHGGLFGPKVDIESLRKFYGQFKNTKLEKLKKSQEAASS